MVKRKKLYGFVVPQGNAFEVGKQNMTFAQAKAFAKKSGYYGRIAPMALIEKEKHTKKEWKKLAGIPKYLQEWERGY